MPPPRIAVLIPCHNEETTVAEVVKGFQGALPTASIYVYDNASTDQTADRAREAGAEVRFEPTPGKGNVVRRMFSDIDADIYVMVDGDATYDPSAAPLLIGTLMKNGVEMVIATRAGVQTDAGRSGHGIGNRMFNRLYRWLFGREFTDIFSGYRVLTRRFVKTFPALSTGFEIETEMSVHVGQLSIPVAEVATIYGSRPDGSESKLQTFRDGFRILRAFMVLLRETRPLLFFGSIGGVVSLAGLVGAFPLLPEYLETGLVNRLPTAVLATGLEIVAVLLFFSGMILDSLARSRVEAKRLNYLAVDQSSTSWEIPR